MPFNDFLSCVHLWWQHLHSWKGGWSPKALPPQAEGGKVEATLPLIQSASQSVGHQTLGHIVMFAEWIMTAVDEKINYLPHYYFLSKTVRTDYYRNLKKLLKEVNVTGKKIPYSGVPIWWVMYQSTLYLLTECMFNLPFLCSCCLPLLWYQRK